MLHQVLEQYGLTVTPADIQVFGSGLINHTWLVCDGGNRYILQRINHSIFKKPDDIAANTRMLANHLAQWHPGYLFVAQQPAADGRELVYVPGDGYYRLQPFITGSHTADVVSTPAQAFEAARQFGRLTRLLSAFPAENLKVTLPDFHNLPLRYGQFETALRSGNPERIAAAAGLIAFLRQHHDIVRVSDTMAGSTGFKKRVTHHDTKISNVLFDEYEKGLCVIDLDTVMPGWFISDVGDMMRTYLSPVSEEEKDYDKIEVRDDFLQAIREGYLGEMGDQLTETEQQHFFYAGKFMMYMQALRFLTDYLNNDVYYGATYEDHNFVRAGNQVVLLQRLLEKEK